MQNESDYPGVFAQRKILSVDPYAVLLTIYIAGLVIAQVLASKLTSLTLPFGLSLNFTGGEIAYCLTFFATDVIAEIWGKKKAAQTVICGLIANILILVLIRITILLPDAPYYTNSDAFRAVVGATSRITIASIIAFLISQFHDVWMFHLLKDMTKGKHLWFRNNLSTFLSQTIDTTIFTVLAFYGVAPVLPLIIGQLTVKLTLAALDTIPVYIAVGYIRKQAVGNE
ncbi:queuosine precursor transporter [bacterium]|nr:queuosine precursor transporter [bacterium]